MEAASLQSSLRHRATRCRRCGDVNVVDVCTESLELTHTVVTRAHIRALPLGMVQTRRRMFCIFVMKASSKRWMRRVLVCFGSLSFGWSSYSLVRSDGVRYYAGHRLRLIQYDLEREKMFQYTYADLADRRIYAFIPQPPVC